MKTTLANFKIGQKGIISDINVDEIPLKLLEMGCLPGNLVELVQIAPFGDPLYFIINDSHVAIRVETAQQITIFNANDSQ
ncbi:MAG: ferrous iron transport protein A [Flavobacterium sp.]|nr:ferrous iron transport protein A [Flavobacterium sp.]